MLSNYISISDAKAQRANDGSLAVSAVFPGSVAHRTGSVQAGDRLLAINNSRVEAITVEEALSSLQSEQVIRLKLHKCQQSADESTEELAPVVYTVELVRHGGPLGITISGTESPDDPITISGLTEGGLAERTGALHAGDRLLAINGRSLQGKLLSEAIEILQNSGDIVTLKIGKSSASKSVFFRLQFLNIFTFTFLQNRNAKQWRTSKGRLPAFKIAAVTVDRQRSRVVGQRSLQ